jgi:hypothetical protein
LKSFVTSSVFVYEELTHLVGKVINSSLKRREINVRQIRNIFTSVVYINKVAETGIEQWGGGTSKSGNGRSSRILWEAFPCIS